MNPGRAIEISDQLTKLNHLAPWMAPLRPIPGFVYQRCARREQGEVIQASNRVLSGNASDQETEQFFARRFQFLADHVSCEIHAHHLGSRPVLSIVRSALIGMDLRHVSEQSRGTSGPLAWACLGCDAAIDVSTAGPRASKVLGDDPTHDAACVRTCYRFCEDHMACSMTWRWRKAN